MKRSIPAILLAAIALAIPTAAHAAPKAHTSGMYQGGWAAFAVITEHMVAGKMSDLNSRPNIVVTRDEHWISNAAEYDDANGFIEWSFVAHVGDFTFRYWTFCTLRNRKIDCGGPGGGPKWHREWWG